MTIRRGWNNFFNNFANFFFAKALDKCNSIEYNEIELANASGWVSELLVVFLAVRWEIIKVQQIKFMGDDLRQRRKGNGNKEKYKEGKDRKEKQ